jgi:hypothetical protein
MFGSLLPLISAVFSRACHRYAARSTEITQPYRLLLILLNGWHYLQMLSRAFRNRFVELHFDEIPASELVTILHKRCDMPLSYCKKMVAVMTDLQVSSTEIDIKCDHLCTSFGKVAPVNRTQYETL